MSKTDDQIKSEIEDNESRAEWGAWAVVAGLVIEIVLALGVSLGMDKKGLENWGTVIADCLIVLGVYCEIHFGRKASAGNVELRRRSEDKVAEANSRAAEAQLETERLRAANLSVQRLLTPRRIVTIVDKDGDAEKRQALFKSLASFAGTEALIQWLVPDLDAKTLAGDIAHLLLMAEWKPTIIAEASPLISPALIPDGVHLVTKEGSLWERTETGTMRYRPPAMSQAARAALALHSFLDLVGELSPYWGVMFDPEYAGMPSRLGQYEIPDGSVLILVGSRPVWEALAEMKGQATTADDSNNSQNESAER
jgi:hypothetical protein